jgi:hypothetical protein
MEMEDEIIENSLDTEIDEIFVNIDNILWIYCNSPKYFSRKRMYVSISTSQTTNYNNRTSKRGTFIPVE